MKHKKRTPAPEPVQKVHTVHPATPPAYVEYRTADVKLKFRPVGHEVEVSIYTIMAAGYSDYSAGQMILNRDSFDELIAAYDALVEDDGA